MVQLCNGVNKHDSSYLLLLSMKILPDVVHGQLVSIRARNEINIKEEGKWSHCFINGNVPQVVHSIGPLQKIIAVLQ